MFKGIVHGTGIIKKISKNDDTQRHGITFQKNILDLVAKDTVMLVNGCSLTVVRITGDIVYFDIDQALNTTTFDSLEIGDKVNLELRPEFGSLLGKGALTGNIKGVATVDNVTEEEDLLKVYIEIPKNLTKNISAEDHIGINGVSNSIEEVSNDIICINYPKNLSITTNLSTLEAGSKVNVETLNVSNEW
ncbi:hypothetical protein AYY19_07430 [Photobacterium aquimaris]|uniref:Lumazine protein n=1 Tax=Photobacterium aquimaris TaxID=512643 RepID=I3VLX7_9GAMM|nr:hypothetical protein [Photobacterium aquimaris]AFK80971.1 lumazine protein [Photobacterium aquimaris]OBU13913.1 hypothetical protein AYY19_07430 [Photobacterium aquimaris]OBU15705.1 hypothetical protein AYY20_07085 [Photobacterium aquimaris]PSU28095.1 hypothetical protein CTM88_13245 [Photobacterium aquimaris]PSW01551.1 hypothetical protein CTM91_07780 [Photobacterium aquimaris]